MQSHRTLDLHISRMSLRCPFVSILPRGNKCMRIKTSILSSSRILLQVNTVPETNRSLSTGRTHPRVVASWTHPSSWWTLYWVSQPPIFLENWFGISTTWVTRTMLPQAAELSLLLLYYVAPTIVLVMRETVKPLFIVQTSAEIVTLHEEITSSAASV